MTITNLQSNTGGISGPCGTMTLGGSWQNHGRHRGERTVNLNGTVPTANLGTLNLSGGTVNLTGTLSNSTWTLNNTGTNWNISGGTIVGGEVNTNGTVLTATSNSALGTTTAGTAVTLSGQLNINVNVTVTVNQGLTLSSGVVQLQGGQNINGGSLGPSVLLFAGSGARRSRPRRARQGRSTLPAARARVLPTSCTATRGRW